MTRQVTLTRPEGFEPEDFHLSRRGLAGLFFAGYALSAGQLNAAAITTSSSGLIAKDLTIASGDAGYEIPAYIALPETAHNRPVIIVVPEVWGLHDYIRDTCRRLAHAGYVALAFDPFARKGIAAAITDFSEVRKLVEQAPHTQVMGDLNQLISWLKSNPDVGQNVGQDAGKPFADTTRMGITGFCWGGAVTWMAAAQIPDIKAGVAWYGRLERPNPEDFLGAEDRLWPADVIPDLTKPVLGLYASDDAGIPQETVDRANAALKASGKTPSHIKVFADSKHAFHADYRPSYKPEAAREGWNDLLAWFGKYL
ncbi:dienelactone hydrolase family protein [Asticcacaulis tiandongensis]|uniref:dienelactone hydrolase family protein n=1 Tax=Asticcacaulis tiandongensis TaxID=2565365 RepID=UPI00112CF757|nr:dienelactone hydrolase family protein [Asticcacaulis tiandongensis]